MRPAHLVGHCGLHEEARLWLLLLVVGGSGWMMASESNNSDNAKIWIRKEIRSHHLSTRRTRTSASLTTVSEDGEERILVSGEERM